MRAVVLRLDDFRSANNIDNLSNYFLCVFVGCVSTAAFSLVGENDCLALHNAPSILRRDILLGGDEVEPRGGLGGK